MSYVLLEDATRFDGEAVGAPTPVTGEVVFNTAMSGYQESMTDPSYARQLITFTYPHIGNYGVNPTDDEAARPSCRGIIVRDLADRPSNWRSTGSLEEFLIRFSVPGITGVDTRRLTRHLRDHGAMPCAFGTAGEAELVAAAAAAVPTDGQDLVSVHATAAGAESARAERTAEVLADLGQEWPAGWPLHLNVSWCAVQN